MPEDKPIWRQMFDAFEMPMAKQAEALVGSKEFSQALVFATEHWQTLSEKNREMLTRVMHLTNMPAYSDITRLNRQVGSLTGKVDTLTERVEALAESIEELAVAVRDGVAREGAARDGTRGAGA